MRVALVSTHRSDRGHYAPLRRLLEADERFELVDHPSPRAEPDVAVVLGDRVEMLQAAIRYVDARIPLLHIHGGEHTLGSLDQRWRWAMSMIADEHCVATREALELGDDVDSRTVHLTGAPGLDGITDRQPFPNAPKVVVLYNPAIDAETTRTEVLAITEAIQPWTESRAVWWLPSNGDRFSNYIPHTVDELDSETFRDLLASAHVIVGNSSAGIIEAPSLGTWTVNIGERQSGRPRASSVLDVDASAEHIRETIKKYLAWERPIFTINPYGDGHASERIRDVLLGMMAR